MSTSTSIARRPTAGREITNSAWVDRMALSDLVAEYLEALLVAGRSPRTVAWYRSFLVEFHGFIHSAVEAVEVV